jgi:uncharacterized membrane protein (DUF4010 family)
MPLDPLLAKFVLILGLGFFFGLAFEEFFARDKVARPGGVRSFPLLGLAGAVLYQLDTERAVPFSVGLAVLGVWLTVYYRQHSKEIDAEGRPNVGLMVPICTLLAYLLGPTALSQPAWVGVGIAVAAVLLLTARERLHDFARRLELREVLTAAQFLILTGLVMPLLPSEPVTRLTDITPHQVWLAVIAVCTVSYASYLVQTYLMPGRGGLWIAVLGGLYSSTATTVVLAREAQAEPARSRVALAGIIAATSVMYLRLLAIIAVFNWSLATVLAPILVALFGIGSVIAFFWSRAAGPPAPPSAETAPSRNPLELVPALVFAALFVAISLLSAWVRSGFGVRGLYVLAAIVGVSDIDPFVLNLAQGGGPSLAETAAATSILIAASSNNLLKAGYTLAFARGREALVPAATLVGLGAAGVALAFALGLA